MHPELILLLGPFWIHDWADDIFCLVCVFQGTAGRLYQPDGEARFPRQMARHRRESDDVFKVRPPRHLARRTGLPVSARQTFRVRISLVFIIHLAALCPGLPGWAGTRKVKPIWILMEQETVSGSGISWAICKSAPRSRQITTPAPHHSVFLLAGCPSCCPTNSVKALKAFFCGWEIQFDRLLPVQCVKCLHLFWRYSPLAVFVLIQSLPLTVWDTLITCQN